MERAPAEVYPALVNNSAVSRRFGEGRAMRYPSAGSGVIVSDQWHVLTNFHVVEGAREIQVMLFDGASHAAKIVGSDPAKIAVHRLGRMHEQAGAAGRSQGRGKLSWSFTRSIRKNNCKDTYPPSR